MTWREKNNLKRIAQWIIAFFMLGYLFSAVVKRQDKVVEKQTAEFTRRLAVSRQYDVTMEQIKRSQNYGK